MTPRMAQAYKLVLGGYLVVAPFSDLPGAQGLSPLGVFFGLACSLLLLCLFIFAEVLGDGNVERLEREEGYA